MRKIVITGSCAVSMIIGAGVAFGADIAPRNMPAKAPVYAPIYNWSGFYAGINGGGGWGNSNFSAPFASGTLKPSGALIGGTLGYNWQMGQAVLGIEGDIDWSNIRGSAPCAATSCETRNSWLSTVRGRLGYAADRFMPYITGGLAVGDIRTSVAGVGSANTTNAGWTIGGGLEAAIAPRITGKIEYLYVDLGHAGTVLGSDANLRTNIVRAGLNYRF
jgi:outer membrane immunogenic protein